MAMPYFKTRYKLRDISESIEPDWLNAFKHLTKKIIEPLQFVERTYRIPKGASGEAEMLVVGWSHTRAAKDIIYAHSDGCRVSYHYAWTDEKIVRPIKELRAKEIHFDPPFKYVWAQQVSEGIIKGPFSGEGLVELMIHFCYLVNDRFDCIDNSEGKDLVGGIRKICTTYEENKALIDDHEAAAAQYPGLNHPSRSRELQPRMQPSPPRTPTSSRKGVSKGKGRADAPTTPESPFFIDDDI